MLRWRRGELLPKTESTTGVKVKGPTGVMGAQEGVRRGVGCNTRGAEGCPCSSRGWRSVVCGVRGGSARSCPCPGAGGSRGAQPRVRPAGSVGAGGPRCSRSHGDVSRMRGRGMLLPPARRRSVPPHRDRGRGQPGGPRGSGEAPRGRQVEREGGSRHSGVGLGGPPALMLPVSNKEAEVPALGRPPGPPGTARTPCLHIPPNPPFPLSPGHPSTPPAPLSSLLCILLSLTCTPPALPTLCIEQPHRHNRLPFPLAYTPQIPPLHPPVPLVQPPSSLAFHLTHTRPALDLGASPSPPWVLGAFLHPPHHRAAPGCDWAGDWSPAAEKDQTLLCCGKLRHGKRLSS